MLEKSISDLFSAQSLFWLGYYLLPFVGSAVLWNVGERWWNLRQARKARET